MEKTECLTERQESILRNTVSRSIEPVTNKIIIGGSDLADFASDELMVEVTQAELSEALRHMGLDDYEQWTNIVDSATFLCHLAADRVCGTYIDEEDREWEEVDISTDWDYDYVSGHSESGSDDVRVVVRLRQTIFPDSEAGRIADEMRKKYLDGE